MDARRADEGFARLYADVYQLRPASVTPLRPAGADSAAICVSSSPRAPEAAEPLGRLAGR